MNRARSRPLLGVAGVLLLLTAACSTARAGGTTTTTTSGSTTTAAPTTSTSTTTAPTTSTTTSTTTTTLPSGQFTLGVPSLSPPEPMGTDGASGSGCPPADFLPDGIWFGFATAIGQNGMDFDPACFFFGKEAAAKAAAEDNEEEPPNPFYIRNTDTETLQILTAADTEVYAIVAIDEVGFDTVAYELWPDFEGEYTPCPGEFCTVWIALNEGVITEVMEQYIP